MSVRLVERRGATAVHLALLWSAAPLCGRSARLDQLLVTDWWGKDDPRTLCEHCRSVLIQLENLASLYEKAKTP